MLELHCACAKLRRGARIASALYDDALASSGLTVAQFSLMRQVQRAGPCSLTQFAAATGFDRTTLNRTLKPLQNAGYVESRAGADQRARIVAITDQGRAVLREAQPRWQDAEARIDAALGVDRATLFSLLDRIESLAG